MTPSALCKRVSDFGFALLEHGFAIDAKAHVLEGPRSSARLTWSDASGVIVSSEPSVHEYLDILKTQNYSALMCDGGIVQVQYMFRYNDVVKHRIVYWPCPFNVQGLVDELDAPIVEIIDQLFLPYMAEKSILRGYIRFDYAPAAAAPGHPASHLTLIRGDCRIPVRAPVNYENFMTFLLENFYPDAWAVGALRDRLTLRASIDCISEPDKAKAHLNWQAA